MGRRHSDMDAERGRRSARRHDFLTPPDLADKRQRSVSGCGPCHDHGRSRDRLVLVRMARSFRSPPEFAHGRPRMRRTRGYLLRNLGLARRLRPRPARTRPPSATPRDRAFTRIVVDRELKRWPLRPRRGVPVQPSQPLDGQVRQEQRDNPSHRTPPRSMRRTRRCVDAPIRPTNGRAPPRQP